MAGIDYDELKRLHPSRRTLLRLFSLAGLGSLSLLLLACDPFGGDDDDDDDEGPPDEVPPDGEDDDEDDEDDED